MRIRLHCRKCRKISIRYVDDGRLTKLAYYKREQLLDWLISIGGCCWCASRDLELVAEDRDEFKRAEVRFENFKRLAATRG